MARDGAPPALAATEAGAARDRPWIVAVALAALGLSVAGLALVVQADAAGSTFESSVFESAAQLFLVGSLIVAGLILDLRRPDHPLGWLLVWLGLVTAVASTLWGLMVVALAPAGDRQLGQVAAWVGAAFALPAWTYLAAALVIRFPNGQPATDAERAIIRWAPVIAVVAGITVAIRPGPLLIYPGFLNPISVDPGVGPILGFGSVVAILISMVPFIGAVAAKVRHYRASTSIERAQLRWFAFSAAITLAAGVAYLVVGVILAPDRDLAREATYAAFVVSAASLPIAILIAITRYHLYDIDRIIGRTVAYGALTAILAGLYAASVRSFNALFVVVTGQSNEAALILTTLVLATTFTPIKSRLEHIAARRFPPDAVVEDAAGTGAPSAEAPSMVLSGAGPIALEDLDVRIEEIARRVAGEVLDERASTAAAR